MLSLAQNPPFGESFYQAIGDCDGFQVRGIRPAGIGRVITRSKSAGDNRGLIVANVNDIAAQTRSPYRPEQASHFDGEACFLAHFPDQRLSAGLTRFDPAPRQRPQPGAGVVAALDKQQPALIVPDHSPHAGDHGAGHASHYQGARPSPASVVAFSPREQWLAVVTGWLTLTVSI
jgi:hypothetical protein